MINKQKLFASEITSVLLLGVLPAHADDYKIDETHSFIQFRTKHLGYSWEYGRFNVIGGTFTYDASNPSKNRIDINVDVNSINTNHDLRDEHLQEKYLHTDKAPKASFKSTAYQGDANSGTVTGELTLNNTTKTVTIPIKKVGEGNDPWGGYRAGFEGTLTIDTRDYGYNYQLGDQSYVVELQLGVGGVRTSGKPAKS